MSLETVEKIYERVFESNIVVEPITFCWHLGEPLAVPISFYENAFALASELNKKYKKDIKHTFQTNATLINDDWIGLIKKHNVEIGVSVDGPKFIHDRMRIDRKGRGTFDDVMKGINKLQESEITIGAIMVLTDYSLDYPVEIFNFLKDNKIYYAGYNVDEIEGIKTETSFNDNSVARYKKFLKTFISLNEEENGLIMLREIWSNMKVVSGIEPFNTMNQPFKIFSFDHLGNFTTFCPELLAAKSAKYNDFIMGNTDTPLDEIKNNPVYNLVQKEISIGLKKCKDTCQYWLFCGGGAPSNKFFEYGTFEVSETKTCKYHKQATVDVIVEYLENKLEIVNG